MQMAGVISGENGKPVAGEKACKKKSSYTLSEVVWLQNRAEPTLYSEGGLLLYFSSILGINLLIGFF